MILKFIRVLEVVSYMCGHNFIKLSATVHDQRIPEGDLTPPCGSALINLQSFGGL